MLNQSKHQHAHMQASASKLSGLGTLNMQSLAAATKHTFG
jgi:hypothetical protein